MSPELDDDHAEAICRVLVDHGVEFVVIGGMAARLHRTGHATVDIDICPARARQPRPFDPHPESPWDLRRLSVLDLKESNEFTQGFESAA